MTSTLASADNSPSKTSFRFPLKSPRKQPRSPSAHSDLAEQAMRCLSPLFGKIYHSTSPSSGLPPPHYDRHPCPLLEPTTSSSPFSGSGSSSGSGHTRVLSAVTNLPEALSWLGDTCIELWIDQEGFRAIRAQFHLAAYTPSPPSSPTADALTHGLAVFRPTRPQRAVYHHGALDPAPVLRRLTLAGSEERDYISRQASLTVKANGVYTVSGAEASEDAPLRWRFEYAVDDLRGEKALLPLSFACPPALLHASHGKRVRLMHVLRKNIAPKLCAKRAAGGDDPALQWLPELPRIPQGAPRTRGPSIHRRTRSSDPAGAPAWPPVPARKARPASVCAARPQPSTASSVSGPGMHQRPCGHAHAHSVASSQLSAHIVSPDELAQILEAFPTPDRPRRDWTNAQTHATELSPPSYYRNRRMLSEMERVDEVGVLVP